MKESLTRKAARVGGVGLAKRLLRPVPVVGTLVVAGLAGYELKRKGVLRGIAHVGLDMLPLIGTAKSAIELFTGDLIPDKERRVANSR
jgi:hypothetical protein